MEFSFFFLLYLCSFLRLSNQEVEEEEEEEEEEDLFAPLVTMHSLPMKP